MCTLRARYVCSVYAARDTVCKLLEISMTKARKSKTAKKPAIASVAMRVTPELLSKLKKYGAKQRPAMKPWQVVERAFELL